MRMDMDAELVAMILDLKERDRPAYDAAVLLLRRLVERKSQKRQVKS